MCLLICPEAHHFASERSHPFAGLTLKLIFTMLFSITGQTSRTIAKHISKPMHAASIANATPRRRYRRNPAAATAAAILSDFDAAPEDTPPGSRSQSRAAPRNTARQVVPKDEECWPVTILIERYPDLRYERWLPGPLRTSKNIPASECDNRYLRGPRGNLLCLWCGQETKDKNSLFCLKPKLDRSRRITTLFGEGCEHEHRMRRDNQYVREQLNKRDRGICFDCGIDIHAVFNESVNCKTLEERAEVFKRLSQRTPEWLKKVRRPLSSMEYKFTEGMFWEAAHIIDVKHGGGLCGLGGYHTLCVPCHNDEFMRNYMTDLSNLPMYQPPPTAFTGQSPRINVAAPATAAIPASPMRVVRPHVVAPAQLAAAEAATTMAFSPSPLSTRIVQTSLQSASIFTTPLAMRQTTNKSKSAMPPPRTASMASYSSSASLPSPTSNIVLSVPRAVSRGARTKKPRAKVADPTYKPIDSSFKSSDGLKILSKKTTTTINISSSEESSDNYEDGNGEVRNGLGAVRLASSRLKKAMRNPSGGTASAASTDSRYTPSTAASNSTGFSSRTPTSMPTARQGYYLFSAVTKR
ncbi:hypothetical protein LPJ66_000959 [Kickxella alabastrina]|uniref:Uncharacterized protein n=1 Tax=Kickxella alabastrina TaxID=61397 RepID=A0ACC1IUL4_9FUNG|nr:hypothetical protein LPJ66_000959 [Kickxella alabastrina]